MDVSLNNIDLQITDRKLSKQFTVSRLTTY